METWTKKLRFWKNYFLRIFPQCVLTSFLFFALYVIIGSLFSSKSNSCTDLSDLAPGEIVPYKMESKSLDLYYETIFYRLYDEGYVSSNSKGLLIEDTYGQDVAALKKIGVADVKGIPDFSSSSFVVSGQGSIPFENNTFDFEFFGYNTKFKYWTEYPADTASEIGRTLKVGGYVAVHVLINDGYSLQSFMNLFPCCTLVTARKLAGLDYVAPTMHEVVLKKRANPKPQECSGLEVKKHMVHLLEPLVTFDRPGHWEGPWGNNKATLMYFPTMVDLSFKERYIYIDLGANSYNSSIGMWFEKEYPKQNKPFEIYAFEPDTAFHEELKSRPGLTLLPYAAWLKNETLKFEVYKMPEYEGALWDKMGYVQDDKESYGKEVVETYSIPAIDFIEWFLRTVTNRDYVVIKMDVEGDEFKLLKKMSEDGVLCLIDELFLECHYDYPGFTWGPKQKKTLSDCIDLYSSLRKDGCITHQWW